MCFKWKVPHNSMRERYFHSVKIKYDMERFQYQNLVAVLQVNGRYQKKRIYGLEGSVLLKSIHNAKNLQSLVVTRLYYSRKSWVLLFV